MITTSQRHMYSSDTYIEKDASINDEIDELHGATSALIIIKMLL